MAVSQHLDGAAALEFVQQRSGLPGGDPDLAGRQDLLRALLHKVISSGTLSNPVALYDLLDATSRSVSLDDTLTNGGLRSLAFDLRGLRPADFTLLNAPVSGTGREGAQSVAYLDEPGRRSCGSPCVAARPLIRATPPRGFVRRRAPVMP